MSKKKKPEKIGVISGLEVIKKTRPMIHISGRFGPHDTQKDKPRDKSYKRNYIEAS